MITDTMSSPSAPKAEQWAFRVLAIGIFLTPLAFLPTNYVALDLIKACVIAAAVIISAILYIRVAWKEKLIALPPRAIAWSAVAVSLSAIISAFAVRPIARSFFGQGFELDTAGFIVILFTAALLIYTAVSRKPERAVTIYAAAIVSFFILELVHALRFIFGSGFLSLGVMTSVTSTILGNWYSIAAYALAVGIIVLCALAFLPLSRKMRIGYSIAGLAAFLAAFFVNNSRMWGVAALVVLGLTLYATFSRPRSTEAGAVSSWVGRIAWLPLIVFIVCALFAWKGGVIAGPAIAKINAGYVELQLPWQQTLDVGVGAIKDSPLLGPGPNRFTQEYIVHKPLGINATDAWSVEFPSGSGLIPTFFITQGLLGIIAWIIFFVFFGIFGARILKALPTDPQSRFVVVSSYAAAAFLWIILLISVPPHAIVFLAFVMTGVSFGSAVAFGALSSRPLVFQGRWARIAPYALGIVALVAVFLGVVYAKDAIAMGYFGSGAKALSVSGNPVAADAYFAKALALNNSDVFWQARAEAGIAEAQKVISSVNSSSPASTTQAAASQVSSIVNAALGYAQRAIAYDPSNYYNYVSAARVSTLAASINMANGYSSAVGAYTRAIQINPQNPALYLSLAQLQAQANNLPDALQTLGAALQVKNNYLDAVYLLSQVEAAQGNLKDAVTAAQVGIQLSPQNPVLYFQLGILDYQNASYGDAATALEKAVSLESDYANARYFLGLSYARLGRTADSLDQFQQLLASNPGNQSLSSIVTALQSGRSLFAPATAPAASAAKSPKLPLTEKGQ